MVSHSLASKPTLQAEADAILRDTGPCGLSWPLTHFIFGTGLMVVASLPSLSSVEMDYHGCHSGKVQEFSFEPFHSTLRKELVCCMLSRQDPSNSLQQGLS